VNAYDETLTVAVLGAGGRIAPALVRDLADSQEVATMRLLDLSGERAASVAATPLRSTAATCSPTVPATG
jgi:predicted dehydrogenase